MALNINSIRNWFFHIEVVDEPAPQSTDTSPVVYAYISSGAGVRYCQIAHWHKTYVRNGAAVEYALVRDIDSGLYEWIKECAIAFSWGAQ